MVNPYKGIRQKFNCRKLTSCCPVLSKKFYKNFRRTIPLNHFKKNNPENSDPPSLETLLKAENVFLPSNISFFWYTFVRKMVTWVSCYRHQSTLPMVLETSIRGFFDVWTKSEVIPSQKRHIWILEKQQNKLKSRIYDGISHELIWKSRNPLDVDCYIIYQRSCIREDIFGFAVFMETCTENFIWHKKL